ncbi:hypothetical protein RJ639_043318 [Escallonia herrerae]|uniref:Uncharacterized protein n=1 Tax=Escallonia herrerae TaxID=1293975 RepID=A0AA88WMV1_9ASTE|nr:hypothetical protein RJ639_043318 [Escallonia herrerae]
MSTSSVREIDPLLKDLSEKKQSFRRNVVSLAAELKELRGRLASQEQSFARETLTRQARDLLFFLYLSNTKISCGWSCAWDLLDIAIISKLWCSFCGVLIRKRRLRRRIWKKRLIDCRGAWRRGMGSSKHQRLRLRRNSTHVCGSIQIFRFMYLNDLDDFRSQLSATQATADASAASAQSAQLQCLALLNELSEKNSSIKEHEVRVKKLGEQLDLLQKDLKAREFSQKQLKDEVMRVEHDIMQALAKAGSNKDCELRKILDEVSPKNFENINKLLTTKDEEIAKLRDEIRIMSAHWKLKTKELESQLEKHRRADQELKKRVLKLEFCLQDARAQTRKLQRTGERRDKALKELRDQLATKQQVGAADVGKENFWESSAFKIVVTMSMLMLVLVSKR